MSNTIIDDGAFDRRCVDQDGLSRMRDNPLRGQQKPIRWPVLLSAAYLFESSSLSGEFFSQSIS